MRSPLQQPRAVAGCQGHHIQHDRGGVLARTGTGIDPQPVRRPSRWLRATPPGLWATARQTRRHLPPPVARARMIQDGRRSWGIARLAHPVSAGTSCLQQGLSVSCAAGESADRIKGSSANCTYSGEHTLCPLRPRSVYAIIVLAVAAGCLAGAAAPAPRPHPVILEASTAAIRGRRRHGQAIPSGPTT